jgi:hypothetical protein
MSGKYVPLIWGVLLIGLGFWSFSLSSGVKYIIGPICFFVGWYSLKAASFLSNDEVDQILEGRQSDRTKKKFENL